MHGTLIFQVYHMIKSIQSCHGHKNWWCRPNIVSKGWCSWRKGQISRVSRAPVGRLEGGRYHSGLLANSNQYVHPLYPVAGTDRRSAYIQYFKIDWALVKSNQLTGWLADTSTFACLFEWHSEYWLLSKFIKVWLKCPKHSPIGCIILKAAHPLSRSGLTTWPMSA